MAITAANREGRLYIGMHPIGSLVRKAQEASSFPKVSEYHR
jgi:hypothetical protein